MSNESLRIIHRGDLPVVGFAGIVETRMVMSPSVWKEAGQNKDISHGFGDFIYLASGYFKPNEGVPLHPHNDVDIVSIILNGEVGHKGTLGDGTVIEGPGIQVQRAGSGMQHAEFSLSESKAEIIQIWFQPPDTGLKPAYQNFKLKEGQLNSVLGGNEDGTFDSNMNVQVGFVDKGQTVRSEKEFVAMITRGTALANDLPVKAGDLIEGKNLSLSSDESFGLVLIQSARVDH